MPISAPKPLNEPPSENPIAESADAPMASPLAAPTPTISFLTMFFNDCDFIFPETVGAPSVLDWAIPKGLLPSFLYCFLMIKLLPHPTNGL